MNIDQPSLLRFAFIVGAVTDGLALIPMLVPSVAEQLWGFHDTSNASYYAASSAAALMLGWTALCAWAALCPMERRFVAPMTMLVVAGLAAAEVVGVSSGALPLDKTVPTWCLQAGLMALFGFAYHFPSSVSPRAVSR